MNRLLILLFTVLVLGCGASHASDEPVIDAENLTPAFYCWGTRDGFAGQFTQNANAVE